MLSSIWLPKAKNWHCLLPICARSLHTTSAIMFSICLGWLSGMALYSVHLHLWTKSAILITQVHGRREVIKIQNYLKVIWWWKISGTFFLNWICCSWLFGTMSHNVSKKAAGEAQVKTNRRAGSLRESSGWTGMEAGCTWDAPTGNEWMAKV